MADRRDTIEGAELRALRQWHRLSALQVAHAVGVSRRRVRQWEDGVPTARAVKRYLDAVARIGSAR